MNKIIMILNGPNLNLLGQRETEVYGHKTLDDLKDICMKTVESSIFQIDFRQSNYEGELVQWVQECNNSNVAGLIINAGAYTHTSIALLDALKTQKTHIIELHLSNIYRREDYRSHSFISEAANGIICGLGSIGYQLAIEAIIKLNQDKTKDK